jgi:protein-disulfide isomerase
MEYARTHQNSQIIHSFLQKSTHVHKLPHVILATHYPRTIHIMEHENTPHRAHQEPRKGKDDSLSIPIAIVFAGILVAGAIIFSEKSTPAVVAQIPTREQAGADTDNAPVDILALKPTDHILGNPNADVVIIEYSDTECPFCKRFHETMLSVMDQYGKSGQVAWVYRHFPLDMHPKARKEAEALECANELGGNAAFWKYTDKLYEITPANNGLDMTMLPKIAEMIGVDVPAFNTCLSSGKYAQRVQKDFEDGANIGVRGTPYSIIWNRKTGKQIPLNGAYPLENVKTMLGLAIEAPSQK